MLVKFCIDPDALTYEFDCKITTNVLHRKFIKQWCKFGILVHSNGNLNDSLIAKKIKELNPEAKKIWMAALTRLLRISSKTAWNGEFPNNNLLEMQIIEKESDVAFSDPVRSELIFNLEEMEHSKTYDELCGLEVCRFQSIEQSTKFQKSSEISEKYLEAGSSCSQEWKSRFSKSIEYANNISIVDRYMFENYFSASKLGKTSGLDRLINDCNHRKIGKVCIDLFSASDDMGDALRIANLLIPKCGKSIREIKIYQLPHIKFKSLVHHRYLRTNNTLFGIDAGIGIFDGDTARGRSVMWHKDYDELGIYQNQEIKLKSICEIKEIIE